MRKSIFCAIAVMMAALCRPLPSHAQQLRAGVAKVEITPSGEGIYLAGYDGRTSPAAGVHDPLHARALVLECAGQCMALVSLDLCWFPSARLAREAKDRLGVGLVLTAASHTHSGPDLLYSKQLWHPARFDAVFRQIEDRVLEAIEKAKSNMFPARLSVANGNITLGYHRLLMQPDGRRRPLFRNPERIPYGPVDPTVGVIRIEDAAAGTTRAIVVNYACHAVCMGGRNLLMSADYPGAMAAKVETTLSPAHGQDAHATIKAVVCLFTQGGAGSVNPLFLGAKDDPPEDFKRAKTMGELLADEVLRALPHAKPVAAPDEIQWRSRTQTFANRWPTPGPEYWATSGPVEIGTATVLINRKIAIMAIPGEPHLTLQMMFKRDVPVEFPVFLGYTTSGDSKWPEYIPDIRAAAEGGYGADRRTFTEVGGGERLVNQAIIDLYWMKGMLSDHPAKK